MVTKSALLPMPADPLAEPVLRFLAVGPRAAPASPDGAETVTLEVPAPACWPDGARIAVRVHRAGRGPAALLVHGWRSQAADLRAPARLLLDAGFTVWMPDLPGHGHSAGEHLSLPLAAATLLAVQAHSGPFALAVGHSFGAASLVHALTQGLVAQRVALLAAPTHYGRFARRAAQAAGVPDERLGDWLAQLAALIEADPDSIDMQRQVAALDVPALLLHSRDDPIVPFEAMARVAAAWPHAAWAPLEGLGHFRLLADAGVLARLRDFAVPAAA